MRFCHIRHHCPLQSGRHRFCILCLENFAWWFSTKILTKTTFIFTLGNVFLIRARCDAAFHSYTKHKYFALTSFDLTHGLEVCALWRQHTVLYIVNVSSHSYMDLRNMFPLCGKTTSQRKQVTYHFHSLIGLLKNHIP